MHDNNFKKNYRNALLHKYSRTKLLITSIILVTAFLYLNQVSEKNTSTYPLLQNALCAVIAIAICHSIITVHKNKTFHKDRIFVLDFITAIVFISSLFLTLSSLLYSIPNKRIIFQTAIVVSAISLFIILLRNGAYNKACHSNDMKLDEKAYTIKKFMEAENLPEGRILFSEKTATREDDLFNLSIYADELIRIIDECNRQSSFVIGLSGPWGSGKTSIINMTREKLMDDTDNYEWTEFNPWLYSTEEAIFRGLWDCLRHDSLDPAADDTVKNIFNRICRNSSRLSLIKDLLFDDDISINSLHESLSSEFAKRKRKLVVFIDDFDRTICGNARFLLRLIHLVFNLPNTIFIIAYESTNLVNTENNDTKEDFADKIINLEINVPIISYEYRKNIYLEALIKLLEHYNLITLEEPNGRLLLVLTFAIEHITTIRQFKRLMNHIASWKHYSNLSLNHTDLITIKLIEFFNPELYMALQENRIYLTSTSNADDSSHYLLLEAKDGLKAMDDIFSSDRNKEYSGIVQNLFPNTWQYFYNNKYEKPGTYTKEDYRDHRIHVSDFFHSYFKFDDSAALRLENIVNKMNSQLETIDRKNKEEASLIIEKAIGNDNSIITDNLTLYTDSLTSNSRYFLAFYLMDQIYIYSCNWSYSAISHQDMIIFLIASFLESEGQQVTSEFYALYDNPTNLNIMWKISYDLLPEDHQGLPIDAHAKIGKEIYDNNINIYDDEHYRARNGAKLKLQGNDAFITYIKKNIDQIDIFRLLMDFVRISYSSKYNYSFENKDINEFEKIGISKKLSVLEPQSEQEQILKEAYIESLKAESEHESFRGEVSSPHFFEASIVNFTTPKNTFNAEDIRRKRIK